MYYSQKIQNITVAYYYAAEEEVEEPPEEPAPEPEPEVLPEPEPELEPMHSPIENTEPDNERKLENSEIKNVLSEIKEENQVQLEGYSARQKDAICEKSGLNTQQVQ